MIYNNCGLVQWLEAKDLPSSKHLSELCGEREVFSRSKSLNSDLQTNKTSVNESVSEKTSRVITPHEIRFHLKRNEQIAFLDGPNGPSGPLRLNKKSYRDIPELAALAGNNPYYKES